MVKTNNPPFLFLDTYKSLDSCLLRSCVTYQTVKASLNNWCQFWPPYVSECAYQEFIASSMVRWMLHGLSCHLKSVVVRPVWRFNFLFLWIWTNRDKVSIAFLIQQSSTYMLSGALNLVNCGHDSGTSFVPESDLFFLNIIY